MLARFLEALAMIFSSGFARTLRPGLDRLPFEITSILRIEALTVWCGDDEESAFIFDKASGSIIFLNYANTDRKRFHGHNGGARRRALWCVDPARSSQFPGQRVSVRSTIHSCPWPDQVGR